MYLKKLELQNHFILSCFQHITCRFLEVAELRYVWWLEIRGNISIRMLSPVTTYAAYLVYKVSQRSHGLDLPAKALVRFLGDGVEAETSVVYLKDPRRVPRGSVYQLSRRRKDGWMEIKLGSFFNGWGDDDGEVEMQLLEVEVGEMKSGLIVQGIEVRLKEGH